MASYLLSLGLAPEGGSVIQKSAHWIMADWAIWMAGHVAVVPHAGDKNRATNLGPQWCLPAVCWQTR
jgi:long-subunit acyl-CoA synthetase (AMP-forming)